MTYMIRILSNLQRAQAAVAKLAATCAAFDAFALYLDATIDGSDGAL